VHHREVDRPAGRRTEADREEVRHRGPGHRRERRSQAEVAEARRTHHPEELRNRVGRRVRHREPRQALRREEGEAAAEQHPEGCRTVARLRDPRRVAEQQAAAVGHPEVRSRVGRHSLDRLPNLPPRPGRIVDSSSALLRSEPARPPEPSLRARRTTAEHSRGLQADLGIAGTIVGLHEAPYRGHRRPARAPG
jgi:hypothetical protein